jgi:site-specific recombinase XerD
VSNVRVTGPLAPYATACAARPRERGHTPLTIVNQLRQVARLSRWLDASGLTAAELNDELVDGFLALQRVSGRGQGSWSRPGLACLLGALHDQGVSTATVFAALSPTHVLMARFEGYLCSERGLCAGTVRGYVRHAERFVAQLAPGTELADVTAREVTGAVLRESAAVSVSTTQNFVAGLRSFLRFCFVEGLIGVDLSQSALPVTGRRRSSLPRGIAPADARALLESCDRRSALGRRDYALIIVLLRLGLRRGEVADLKLDDIDWRMGELVVRGKGGRADRLPLPTDVGEAIAAYLRGRPGSSRREVFLRARAPFDPIAPSTVASTVRRACRRAGIAEVGSHRLRHTMACEMVAAGVPLVEIAQVLRHQSLQSTVIYARVNLEQLRQLAQPWPGGGSR